MTPDKENPPLDDPEALPYPWNVFDRAQFNDKMTLLRKRERRELQRQYNEALQRNKEKGINVLSGRQVSELYMNLLRRLPRQITRLACEVMKEQGLAFTPAFYRGIIERLAQPILIREAEWVIYHIEWQLRRRPPHDPKDVEYVGLSRIIEEETIQLEIDARKLEYQACTPSDEGQTTELQHASSTHLEIPAGKRERGPNLTVSRKRVVFEDKLRQELSTVKARLGSHQTLERLKREFPSLLLWDILSSQEQRELFTVEFKPRHYARSLTCRKFDVSRYTLEKDRQKLRNNSV